MRNICATLIMICVLILVHKRLINIQCAVTGTADTIVGRPPPVVEIQIQDSHEDGSTETTDDDRDVALAIARLIVRHHSTIS